MAVFNQVHLKYSGIFCACLAFIELVACSSVPPKKTQSEAGGAAMGRASVVSMGTLNLDPQKPSTISWLSAIDVVGSQDAVTANGLNTDILKAMTQSAIEQQIIHKGYSVLPIAGDYQMKALLVLAVGEHQNPDSSVQNSELLQEAGVDPGLAGGQLARGKGSLVIELRQGHALRWRGAVQIYLLPESDANMASRRIEHAVAQLLLTWPDDYKK